MSRHTGIPSQTGPGFPKAGRFDASRRPQGLPGERVDIGGPSLDPDLHEVLMALARAVGRQMAEDELERSGDGTTEKTAGGDLRPVFERPSEPSID
jgi:hypothetical protein